MIMVNNKCSIHPIITWLKRIHTWIFVNFFYLPCENRCFIIVYSNSVLVGRKQEGKTVLCWNLCFSSEGLCLLMIYWLLIHLTNVRLTFFMVSNGLLPHQGNLGIRLCFNWFYGRVNWLQNKSLTSDISKFMWLSNLH